MSKLASIRKALNENPHIAVLGCIEEKDLPKKMSGWGHTVNFIVAPTAEETRTLNELQAILLSLSPAGLEPSARDDFRGGAGFALEFGKLYFDEPIGTMTTRYDVSFLDADTSFPDNRFYQKRSYEESETISRRVWISLFPNHMIATLALQRYGHLCRLPNNELKMYGISI